MSQDIKWLNKYIFFSQKKCIREGIVIETNEYNLNDNDNEMKLKSCLQVCGVGWCVLYG